MRENTPASQLPVNQSQIMGNIQSDVPSMLAISEEYGEVDRKGSIDARTEAIRRANRTIDEQLVRMLQQIESQAMKQVELFGETLERHKNNKKFHAALNGRRKEIEAKRREERQEAAREREKQNEIDRKAKNLARMEKKKNVQANVWKRMTYRSPQPQVRVFKQKVEQTQDNMDLMKYLGFELDAVTETNSEGRLASRGSMRSNSVPPSQV